MSVRIILASHTTEYNPQVGVVVINDPRTCLASLARIREAATTDTATLTVVVRDASATEMLEVFRGQRGIEFYESDARVELSKRWGYPLPVQLTKEVIEALRLLEVDVLPSGNVVGTVLSRAYSTSIFSLTKLSAADESELLNLLAQGHPHITVKRSIDDLLVIQLRNWGEHGSRISKTLAGGLDGAAWYLALLVLSSYPQAIQKEVKDALKQTFGNQPIIDENILATLPLEPKYLPAVVRLPLERNLRSYLLKLPLSDYLSTVSGVLPVELEVLEERAADIPGSIDLISAKTVFAKLSSSFVMFTLEHIEQHWRAAEALSVSIEELVKGKRPDKAFSEIADFYLNHYLSVKEVYGSNASALEQLLSWNEEFAAWLVHNYHRLIVAPEALFASGQLRNRLQTLLENGRIPMLWVIDGLSWRAFSLLQHSAARGGLFLVGEPKACLAPIPTITEIGMTALISGEPVNAFASKYPNRNGWQAAREKCFRQCYPNARLGRANNPTQISEILSAPASIYLLQTSLVDKYVHDHDLDQELFECSLDTYFEVQCRAFVKAIERMQLHRPLRDFVVVIATDHGYTDILRQGVAQLPAGFATETDLVDSNEPHHCVIEINLPPEDTDAGGILRSLLKKDWYLFSGDGFNLPNGSIWVVPKKQQRTRGGSLRVHGRPSLEETIVPIAEFTFAPQEVLKLQLAVQGRLIKDTECKATLLVTNEELFPVKDIIIEMPAFQTKLNIPHINSNTVEAVPIKVRAQTSGNLAVKARIASFGGPFQWREFLVQVEQSDTERLLGEDRVAKFFDEEEI